MNKFLGYPLLIMIIIAILSLMQGLASSSTHVIIGDDGIEIEDGNANDTEVRSYDAPGMWNLWGLIEYDPDSESSVNVALWVSGGIVAALIAAVAVASVSGLSILGSGLSQYTQSLILNSIIYLGMWGALTIMGSAMIIEFDFLNLGVIIYCILSIMFVIGFLTEVNGTGST